MRASNMAIITMETTTSITNMTTSIADMTIITTRTARMIIKKEPKSHQHIYIYVFNENDSHRYQHSSSHSNSPLVTFIISLPLGGEQTKSTHGSALSATRLGVKGE